MSKQEAADSQAVSTVAECKGDVVSGKGKGKDQVETISLCVDQAEWLLGAAERHCPEAGAPEKWQGLRQLIDCSNREPPKTKKTIFLTVRCRRCLQHTRGGDKREYEIELPADQWQWLESVKERCTHSSVSKTIRIMIDFYKPLCEFDAVLEQAIFKCRESPGPSIEPAAA
ncbi:unnamed protein product [Polarella glacialis]|uniref:Uncharacterized protein n=1 Tax=Polarella glacialis TaxID=89957 RepID=A0A813KRH5_POLGL|nr:unnamed protein product [Polarella glacialis]CAE8614825.1 unnamed protein product [Polarella glacialis]CAE8710015.1 unnamed protein product [Polarella glacialis]|mmetsp:Transcript_12853/g.23009  ORF Transcript_12853/g.23009 Transcript_12853/m.23009 type:complete len:171 (+) Transcript_12853:63-575(+)|eukprot:CAMPEP_0115123400 /NCGR_PEP_ID=MMETSP0227-20121206/47507_1 /TAXON_ID=89957 /ORGANISM="Polarella glacialis, Strain CCMP 1383" /LENGTH=170 /DNA_ID=CAMNT_0002525739 /DNA_START=63 /DNA_END=575 /DNA_ORIENTATION=-